ncbi:MAG TPA: type VI secretion system-associated protein TagF [Rhodothermales bacterium]|nr:type VI secretion system-associated protein TagF [Rhodothermales bacterium]
MDAGPQLNTATRPLVCFGKLPTCGDFVRHNASSPAVRSLEEWLQQGLYLAKPRMARAGDSRPARYGFVFSDAGGEESLTGTLRLSRDSVGRVYPFVVASVQDGGSSVSPLRLMDSFTAFGRWASAFVDRAAEGEVDCRHVGDALASAPSAETRVQPETAARLADASFRDFCVRTWGAFDDDRKYIVFKNLLDVAAPLRGGVPSRYSLAIQCPLGMEDGRSVSLAFWIELIHRLVGAASATLFWTEDRGGMSRPFLLLYPGIASAKGAPVLFIDAFDSDGICDLERMGNLSRTEAERALPGSCIRLLEDENISLREFAASL